MSRKPFSIHLIRVVLVVSILGATGLLGTSTVYADDGDESVGAVGLNNYRLYPLLHSVESAEEFYDYLTDNSCYACSDSYFMQDEDVYEEHFKMSAYGGKDYLYADDVDICWFQGHSDWKTDKYGNEHKALWFIEDDYDDAYLEYWEAKWGDKDLEWMLLHCCRILSDENRGWWAWARNGIHLICGAKTTMQNRIDGGNVADYLVDDPGWYDWAHTVKWSWFHGCDINQSSAVTLCVIGETHECGDDYIWCEGEVCDDPQRDSTYNVWTYYCS